MRTAPRSSRPSPSSRSEPQVFGLCRVPNHVTEATQSRDRELLARAAQGEREAFRILVEAHQDRVLSLCRRYLGDQEEARDAAQDVFLKVWRKAGSYRPRGQVSTWVHRIAVNHCLNLLRRRKIVRFLPFIRSGEDDEAPDLEPEDPSPGPAEVLEARSRWNATRRAIDALPESQRSVLILAKFEGLSYKEIAETLGITVGAVESRLFRAMRRLEEERETAQEIRVPRVSRGETES